MDELFLGYCEEPEELFQPELQQPLAMWIQRFYCVNHTGTVYKVIWAMVLGILTSPFSYGLFYLLVAILLTELLVYIYGDEHLRSFDRCAVICASAFGYIIGRTISGDLIEQTGFED